MDKEDKKELAELVKNYKKTGTLEALCELCDTYKETEGHDEAKLYEWLSILHNNFFESDDFAKEFTIIAPLELELAKIYYTVKEYRDYNSAYEILNKLTKMEKFDSLNVKTKNSINQ
jgi:hypothetical protein